METSHDSETVTSNGAREGDPAEEALARKLSEADERLAVLDAEAAKIRAEVAPPFSVPNTQRGRLDEHLERVRKLTREELRCSGAIDPPPLRNLSNLHLRARRDFESCHSPPCRSAAMMFWPGMPFPARSSSSAASSAP